jgi:dephospho-CoA kinase
MIKIGLTGSIGMGKSETAKIFKSLGFPVYDADKSVHKLYRKGQKGAQAIKKIFPSAINSEGDVDRSVLGGLVVGDKANLKKLESIIHPLVGEDRLDFFKDNKSAKAVVLDIPLLFETGGEKLVDYTIVVTTSYEIQKKRVLGRKNMNEKKFKEIVSSQTPNNEKCRLANFIVDTSISVDDAKKQVKDILLSLEL